MFQKSKNPWLVAAAIAVLCMFLDDLPEPGYNTFHDPGAAAMLSIILANATTLVLRRGWTVLAVIAFLPALVLKFFFQPFFWVQNAAFVDFTTLLVVHALLGYVALRGVSKESRFLCGAAAFAAIAIALVVVILINATGSSWIHFYFAVGAARIVAPLAFWTAVPLAEKFEKITPPGV